MKHFFLFCSALALSVPALAAPYTYGSEDCEFQITFPEKPFIEKKCAQNITDCAEVATYTKAIGTEGSTNFRVSCNPISAADVQKFTPEIIQETLHQLVKASNLEPYNSSTAENDGYKSASTIALTTKDDKPMIYNGQIWIGKKSMFTIEAEIVGQNDEIDKTFAQIMRNTYPKSHPPQVANETAKSPEKEKTTPPQSDTKQAP